MTIQGKKTPLPVTDPNDEAGAWDAFRALVAKAVKAETATRSEPLATLVSVYLDSIGHRITAKTRKGYAVYLRRFAALFGERCAADIDAQTVEKGAAAEKWSDTNRANYLVTVQTFVRWAGRKDFSLNRPTRESRGADAVIDDATQRLILREATGDFHDLCRFLWAVGCRPMEAAQITAEMVDWASGTVTLKQHKTKHKGKRRILYLSSEALVILQGQVDRYRSGPLFRGQNGKQITLRAIVGRFLRISEKVGRTVTSYGYRHTWATRALSAGIPETHVAALMGHSSTAQLHRNYSHVSSNSRLLRETAEKMVG